MGYEHPLRVYFAALRDALDTVKNPKLMTEKRAVCRNCGTAGPDFSKCTRCKRPLPKDCKVIEATIKAKGAKKNKPGKRPTSASDESEQVENGKKCKRV